MNWTRERLQDLADNFNERTRAYVISTSEDKHYLVISGSSGFEFWLELDQDPGSYVVTIVGHLSDSI